MRGVSFGRGGEGLKFLFGGEWKAPTTNKEKADYRRESRFFALRNGKMVLFWYSF